eukprot:Hpha_TRINITY_DN9911_c0_g1::TRINITY_DN9911_c0_g1_i2::g.140448::m.140448
MRGLHNRMAAQRERSKRSAYSGHPSWNTHPTATSDPLRPPVRPFGGSREGSVPVEQPVYLSAQPVAATQPPTGHTYIDLDPPARTDSAPSEASWRAGSMEPPGSQPPVSRLQESFQSPVSRLHESFQPQASRLHESFQPPQSRLHESFQPPQSRLQQSFHPQASGLPAPAQGVQEPAHPGSERNSQGRQEVADDGLWRDDAPSAAGASDAFPRSPRRSPRRFRAGSLLSPTDTPDGSVSARFLLSPTKSRIEFPDDRVDLRPDPPPRRYRWP